MKSLLLVLCLCVTLSACTGPFTATKRYHGWTRSMEGKWVEEVVFLIPGLIVYPLMTLGDALIFNSIEFWGWDNPAASAKP